MSCSKAQQSQQYCFSHTWLNKLILQRLKCKYIIKDWIRRLHNRESYFHLLWTVDRFRPSSRFHSFLENTWTFLFICIYYVVTFLWLMWVDWVGVGVQRMREKGCELTQCLMNEWCLWLLGEETSFNMSLEGRFCWSRGGENMWGMVCGRERPLGTEKSDDRGRHKSTHCRKATPSSPFIVAVTIQHTHCRVWPR